MNTRALLLIAVLFTAAGCTPQTPTGTDSQSPSSSEAMLADSSSSETLPETNNVTYTGVLSSESSADGATHTLLLDSGRSLPLLSTDSNLQLSSYTGKRIDVRGSIVVTNGVSVLRVTEVVVLDSMTSSSSSNTFCGGIAAIQCPTGMQCVDDPSDSCDPLNGGADCGGMCVASVSSSAEPSSSSLSSTSPTSSSSVSAAVISSSSSVAASAPLSDNEQDVVLMAKQNYVSPSLWTQKYCTSHIAFCVPVHKNWYYKSFGATTSTLWHVEFGMTDIQSLGQGTISLNLISGSSSNAGGEDGAVQTKGNLVIGYKDWDGRHIEITADARLSEAVSYMVKEMQRFTPDE